MVRVGSKIVGFSPGNIFSGNVSGVQGTTGKIQISSKLILSGPLYALIKLVCIALLIPEAFAS